MEDPEIMTSSVMTAQSHTRAPASLKSKSLHRARFEHGRIFTTNAN